MILKMFAENYAAVDRRRAPAGNRGPGRIAHAKHFAHASRGIVRGDALDCRVTRKESFALGQRDRMGRHLSDAFEHSPRYADQIVDDWNYDLGLNMQATGNQQIVGTMDRTRETIFDWRQDV